MDFIRHANIFVPELTGLFMTVWDGDTAPLAHFEKQFCFLPNAQPLYTVEGLRTFFEKKDGSHIYILADSLNTCATFIKIENYWIILGPYVTDDWQETAAKILLAKYGARESLLLSYKSYRCTLPIMSVDDVTRIATILLSHTVGNMPPHEIEWIDIAAPFHVTRLYKYSERYEDVEIVNQRYALVAQISDAITQGKATEAIRLLHDLERLASSLRFLSNEKETMISSAVLLRSQIRHAAMQAGMAPIQIDALSQEYAQKMSYAANMQQLSVLMDECIGAFCAIIRTMKKSNYSVHVERAIQYIETYMTQPITTEEICRSNGLSTQYFAQMFKKETGKTVAQFMRQRRCELAAELLENSSLQIQEISHFVGYDDTNYFARVFKTVMKITPQEYRNKKTFLKS